jgi:hypothetical protein
MNSPRFIDLNDGSIVVDPVFDKFDVESPPASIPETPITIAAIGQAGTLVLRAERRAIEELVRKLQEIL